MKNLSILIRERLNTNVAGSVSDTGSPEVQVAILSERIASLNEHFKTHAKDNYSRRELLRLGSQRRQLLDYLKRTDKRRYEALIAKLGLKDRGIGKSADVFFPHSEKISPRVSVELPMGPGTTNSAANSLEGDDAIVDLSADLGTAILYGEPAYDWATQTLRQSADKFQEMVIERRELLANVALIEWRIDRTQQETARILGGLIKG